MSKKRAAILLAEGFEEIEALTPADLLRRGDVDVVLVGVSGREITGSRNVTVVADLLLENMDIQDFDAVIVPGGMPGSTNLAASPRVGQILRDIWAEGKLLAAICAAPPVVLAPLGLLDGKKATCFPGAEAQAPEIPFQKEGVVIDGSLITAQGPGKAAGFSFAILEALQGAETADHVKKSSLFG